MRRVLDLFSNTSRLAATMMAELLKSGDLQTHIEKVLNPAYRRRYEIMIQAIQRYLVPLGVTVGEVSFEGKAIFGGYFIWLELPGTKSAELVAERAKQDEGLIVAPGHIFEVSGDSSVQFKNSLRLCFSWEEEPDLAESIVRLARVLKSIGDGDGSLSGNVGTDKQTSKQDLGEFQ